MRNVVGPLGGHLVRLAIGGGGADLPVVVRQQVRANTTETWLHSSTCLAYLGGSVMLNQPVADFMNFNLRVENHMNCHQRFLRNLPGSHDMSAQLVQPPPSIKKC